MQTRIRHIAHRRKGLVTESEKLLDKQTISLGRATDQDIFLPDTGVSYQHARINLLPDGVVSVSSVSRLGFYIEGSLVQNCLIRRRGEMTFGAYRVTVEINSKQNLVDITVEKLAEDIVEMQESRDRPLDLEHTWLSKRQLSWLGFAVVLVLFLVLPIAAFHDDRAGRMVEELDLPDDAAWLSGAISSPHRHFADDCNQCHQQPFVQVRDNACLACHDDITAHSDPAVFDLPRLHLARCASCHHEHEGSEHLVQKNQKMCSDCHSFLGNLSMVDLNNISDFGTDHSQFRATLMPGYGKSRNDPDAWKRVSLDDPSIRQDTGIVFPHDLHLDRQGIQGPNGKQRLDCDDCHRTDASGNYMIPITMEGQCQSCHRLEFDPADPERELPHSDLRNLRKMLDEYYSLAALRGGVADESAPDLITQRRRPGKSLTREETDIALKWALQKSAAVAEEVIELRSCNLCHKVRRDPKAEFGWVIPEVNTSQPRWFPKGFFAHDAHRNTSCETCHDAATSSQSEDVLLPGIEVCRDCHGGQHAENKLQSTCIECHSFHQPDQLLMRITRKTRDD
jgi:predicted CXXCH cytochrome family protein